ncbi:MAG: acyl-ACP--UDP-N-acetylglucosamine O-acyltransferase [Leptospiraceae bacterium]|nr:acyl-ACP--UDP-N-acetylglucosamine O-acyltransferase [Leptospiraceae bacterium]MCP5494254.1 acyl-ACP--UDP-N-acetylglucosamine O-acyltransferase [Leptospiraceae bacterium]
MAIHATAIIDASAEIHQTADIGPFCIVGKNVKIGEGSVLESSVRVYDNVTIGKFNIIKHCAAIGNVPQDLHFDPKIPSGVEIGDHNRLCEYFTVHRSKFEGSTTKIGNHCFLMENTHIAHDSVVEDHVIMVHCAATAGHVHISNYAFISGLTAIHQYSNVGTYAMIAGCSKIVKDVPPYSTVDGNPATVIGLNSIGLKRAGLPSDVRNKIKQVYKTLYHSGINITQALVELKKIENPILEEKTIIDFFANSERGVTDHR